MPAPALHAHARPAPHARRGATPLPASPRATGSATVWAAARGTDRPTLPGGGEGDRATTIQLLADVNRSAGNRAATDLVASTRPPVQRDDDDNPHAEPAAGYTLANARFAGNTRLQEIAGGGAALAKSDPATAVKPVQTALLDLGYSLLRYKDDGRFGNETAEAIAQFRSDRGVTTGDGMDAAAIRRLDRLAPAPGKKEEHYLDYSRLFEDGKLDVTLAIGYDEGQSHFADLDTARAWMDRMKLVKASPAAPPPAPPPPGAPDVITGASPVVDPNADTKKGISTPETYSGKRTVTYPDTTGARVTKEIAITITLVPPGTGGKAAFAKGLNDSEITLYSGHARRGIGPDFDADKSPYENFVLGVGSALHKAGRVQAAGAVAESHYVIDKKNDLEAMKAAGTWNEEKYRVWFFNACSSIAYVDELRGGLLPEKMDRHNLDLFGTTQSVPIAAGLSPVLANLEGILAGETMEQIVVRMRTSMLDAFRKELARKGQSEAAIAQSAKEYKEDVFIREGAGDNPVAAAR